MATQHAERKLLLNLYREENISLVCFFLPLKRDKYVWHLQPSFSTWRPLAFLPVTLSYKYVLLLLLLFLLMWWIQNFYLLPIMLVLFWFSVRKGILIFSNAFQGLWRRALRILLKYHFLHVPPNTMMSLISPVKIKHPPLPAFTLFLCLVISIAIIVRHWLPESETVLFLLGCCNKYHRPSSIWTAEMYFLTVIGAEKSRIKVNAESMTREGPLSGS